MATVQLPKMPTRPAKTQKPVKDRDNGGNILPRDISYTTVRARKACIELGLPPSQLPPLESRDIERQKGRKLTSPNDIVTEYLRALNLKKRRKQAAATIVIGRSRTDYVTHSSQWTSQLLLTHRINAGEMHAEGKMGKRDLKGILHQDKQSDATKRVTFNDDVRVEEFKPNSAIIQKAPPSQNCSVTKDSAGKEYRDVVGDGLEPLPTIEESDKRIKNSDETKQIDKDECDDTITPQKRSGKYDLNRDETIREETVDCDVIEQTEETRENNQLQHPNIRKGDVKSTSGGDLIPSKRPIVPSGLAVSGTRHLIDEESGHLSIQNTNVGEKKIVNLLVKSNGKDQQLGKEISDCSTIPATSDDKQSIMSFQAGTDVSGDEDTSLRTSHKRGAGEDSDNSEFDQEMDLLSNQLGEENHRHDSSKVYRRKHLKKKFAPPASNLPVIREELNSRASNVSDVRNGGVIHDTEKNGDDATADDLSSQRRNKQETDDRTLLSRDDIIKKVRDDARLSAIRGQIAADKAAWTCVIRYPRRASATSRSDQISPLNSDVIYDVRRSPKLHIPLEKRNTFLPSAGEKLTIYRHNFGPKFRAPSGQPSSLPPLLQSRLHDVRLVTQRQNTIWVPNVSVVPRTKKQKVKGSRVGK